MTRVKAPLDEVISHWYYCFDDMRHSPQEFYNDLARTIKQREIPNLSLSRVEISEGGVFSAKRIYLRVWRKRLLFDICAAPFGRGFFVSWWLSEPLTGCLAILLRIPILNLLVALFLPPLTYYRIDTALMFQEMIHNAVMEVIDEVTTHKGVRALTEDERKPIMREFFRSGR